MALGRDDLLAVAERELVSARLRLEPMRVAHAALLFEQLSDPRLYEYVPADAPPALDALEAQYSRWSRRASTSGDEIWYNYALWAFDCSGYVGTLQATVPVDEYRAFIAYQVFPRFRRRGLAREGCRAMLAALREAGVRQFVAHVDTRNVASRALLESLGFTCVARIDAADEFKGAVSDEFVYWRE